MKRGLDFCRVETFHREFEKCGLDGSDRPQKFERET